MLITQNERSHCLFIAVTRKRKPFVYCLLPERGGLFLFSMAVAIETAVYIPGSAEPDEQHRQDPTEARHRH